MTKEFIYRYCVTCNHCIYEDEVPTYCGTIDDGGCCSIELSDENFCRKGYEPIPHNPRFNKGDRILTDCGIEQVIDVVKGVEGYYLIQLEGYYGRGLKPFPIQKKELERFDELREENDLVTCKTE